MMARTKKRSPGSGPAQSKPKAGDKKSGAGQRDAEGSKGERGEMTFAAFEKLAQSKRLKMSHLEGDDTGIAELVMDAKKFYSGSVPVRRVRLDVDGGADRSDGAFRKSSRCRCLDPVVSEYKYR